MAPKHVHAHVPRVTLATSTDCSAMRAWIDPAGPGGSQFVAAVMLCSLSETEITHTLDTDIVAAAPPAACAWVPPHSQCPSRPRCCRCCPAPRRRARRARRRADQPRARGGRWPRVRARARGPRLSMLCRLCISWPCARPRTTCRKTKAPRCVRGSRQRTQRARQRRSVYRNNGSREGRTIL